MKLVIDTNCIIDFENRSENYVHLMIIASKWKSGDIDLGVVAISASENQKGKRTCETFVEFENKLENAGLKGVQILLPMAYYDICYREHALLCDDNMSAIEEKIHKALFPGTSMDLPDGDESMKRKWRNKKCDVQIVWATIYHKWDALVTNDDNFHKKAKHLLPLGLKDILSPCEAANRIALQRRK